MNQFFPCLLLVGLATCLNNPSPVNSNNVESAPINVGGATSTTVNQNNTQKNYTQANQPALNQSSTQATTSKVKHFKGALNGGLKGDSIFFDISADGKKLENLTFKGYWRCSGKLEQLTAVGPDGSFDINNGNVKGHISDPPNGGSTAWRFDIDANITGNTATGTFRMNINNLGCDTYLLKFSAVGK
ncbi:MAG: hypothetical protein ABIP69_00500 [Ferruginibacter sp.]